MREIVSNAMQVIGLTVCCGLLFTCFFVSLGIPVYKSCHWGIIMSIAMLVVAWGMATIEQMSGR
jgi:uncharacterized membrane protein (DUF485 family)